MTSPLCGKFRSSSFVFPCTILSDTKGSMLRSTTCAVRGIAHGRTLASRSIHTGTHAHTLLHPTPSSLTSYLSSHPPSPSSPLMYLLSTSIPPSILSPLMTTLQSIPNSIGSFSNSPPNSGPSLSIASFNGGRTIRTGKTGRPGAEVGKWQRPNPTPEGRWGEDRKGGIEGDLGMRREMGEGGGWEEVWRAELEVDRIPELEGLK